MNSNTPRAGTLIGLPAMREEPFPLTPYVDVHTYTPSGARATHEPTPVHIPPARRLTAQEREVRTILLKRRCDPLEPSRALKLLATVIVCYVIAIGYGIAHL